MAALSRINGEILPAQTTRTVPINALEFPVTVTLKSSEAGAKIELSVDGVEFFEPEYDHNSATQKVVAIISPINFVKFTGAAGDDYFVV